MAKIDVTIYNSPHKDIRKNTEKQWLGNQEFPKNRSPSILFFEHEGKTIEIRLIES